MKSGTDDLFQLIHALSPSEKRYVSIRNASEPSALYVQLYSLIDRQETYSEEHVLSALKANDATVNLPMLKKYLERYLIAVLSDYHGSTNELWQHSQAAFISRILHEKGLNKTVIRLLKSGREASVKAENYIQLLNMLRIETMYAHELYGATAAVRQKELHTETRDVLAIVAVDNEYAYLQSTLQRMMREQSFASSEERVRELRELLENQYVRDDAPRTARQMITYTSIRSRIHLLLGENDSALEYALRNVGAWETIPEHQGTMLISYAGALNNCFSRALYAHRFDLLNDIREKIGVLPIGSHEMKLFVYQSLTQLDLMLVYVHGKYDALTQIIQRFEDASEEFQRYTPQYMIRSIWINIAQLLTVVGNWEDSLRYINNVVTMPNVKDVFTQMSVSLQLVVHFELGNDKIVESLRRSIKRTSRIKSARINNESAASKAWELDIDLADMIWKLFHLPRNSEESRSTIRQFAITYHDELELGRSHNPIAPFAIAHWIDRNS